MTTKKEINDTTKSGDLAGHVAEAKAIKDTNNHFDEVAKPRRKRPNANIDKFNYILDDIENYSTALLVDTLFKAMKEANEGSPITNNLLVKNMTEFEALVRIKNGAFGMRPARTLINFQPADTSYIIECRANASRMAIESKDSFDWESITVVAYGKNTSRYEIDDEVHPVDINRLFPVEIKGNENDLSKLQKKFKKDIRSSLDDKAKTSLQIEIINYFICSEHDLKGNVIDNV